MSGRRVIAAVVQAGPVGFDTEKTIDKLGELTAQAASGGAELVVFPEAFVGSYPKGLDFGARLGSRTPAGREDFRRYFEAAMALPGPELDRVCAIAGKAAVHLVAGVIERGGGTLYCTVVFIGPDGSFLGKHRKLMPTAMERIVWGFGDGSTMPVIDTPIGKLGAVICWENYMPMMRMAMYAKGIELYCAPTVDDRDQWHHAMRHIAWEGRCFVLCACQHTRRRDFPADYDCIQGNDPDAVLIRGGSVIVSPLGEVLAGPVYGEDAVLTAELDLDEIARGKYDLDVTGHYSRPDVFQLKVNEAPQRVVRVTDDPCA